MNDDDDNLFLSMGLLIYKNHILNILIEEYFRTKRLWRSCVNIPDFFVSKYYFGAMKCIVSLFAILSERFTFDEAYHYLNDAFDNHSKVL